MYVPQIRPTRTNRESSLPHASDEHAPTTPLASSLHLASRPGARPQDRLPVKKLFVVRKYVMTSSVRGGCSHRETLTCRRLLARRRLRSHRAELTSWTSRSNVGNHAANMPKNPGGASYPSDPTWNEYQLEDSESANAVRIHAVCVSGESRMEDSHCAPIGFPSDAEEPVRTPLRRLENWLRLCTGI